MTTLQGEVVGALLTLALGKVSFANGAGGYLGVVLARLLADSLNRTGSIIVILTNLVTDIIYSILDPRMRMA